MKEIVRCNQCDCQIDVLYKCDTCGEKAWSPQLTLIIDFEEYHFCNLKCLLDYINPELAKER